MLQNAYFLAKIDADTAENEQHFAEILPRTGACAIATMITHHPVPLQAKAARRRATSENVGGQKFGKMLLVFGCIGSDFCKQICVLQHFSKSTRFSSWNFWNLAIFCKFCKFCDICEFFAEISRKLLFFQTGFFFEFFEIAAVQKDANLVELEKCCQTHIFLQNFVLI